MTRPIYRDADFNPDTEPKAHKALLCLVFALGAIVGSRTEIFLQQTDYLPKIAIAQEGPTYLDSSELSPADASELKKSLKRSR